MPMFEYRCESCNTRFEKLTSHARADAVACAACGKPARRLLSVFGVASARASSPCVGGDCPLPACAGGQPTPGGCRSCNFQ